MKKQVAEKIKAKLNNKQNIAVITGAGMSTASGIPDFRSAGGIYDQVSGIHYSGADALSDFFLQTEPDLFYENFFDYIYRPDAEPNEGHYFLKELEKNGHRVDIITQNIDGLHQKAGSDHVHELHGSALRFITTGGQTVSYKDIYLQKGKPFYDDMPVRPDVVLYGESLDQTVLLDSIQAVQNADLLLVLGTSLQVYPAAGLPDYFTGEFSILINRDPTPLDNQFTYVIQEDILHAIKELEKVI